MERIIGIDFGTTNSAVALYDGSTPRVMTGDDGETIMPSVVYIDEDGKKQVGAAARNVALLYPENTIMSVKRQLGTGRKFALGGESYSAERIASFIFAALRQRCEKRIGNSVNKAVVSVPAYFDDLRRRSVREAASMAGIEVVRLINEPTAAALAYQIGADGTAIVYDLGGGTFDVSVLEAGDGVYRVLSSRGDTHLGSDDFDHKLIELLSERFFEETGVELNKDRLAVFKLRIEVERAKIALSTRLESSVDIPFIAANIFGACHLHDLVTRDRLEKLVGADVDRTIRLTRGALSDAGLRSEDIDHVLLVGGPTRMPLVRAAVTRLMGREPERNIDPELAVARGAAIQGGIIGGTTRKTLLVDVTPLGLGVETDGGELVTLLPRNSVLPAEASAVFTTVSDKQRKARVTVLQGERPRADGNVSIGSFDLDGIEEAPMGEPEILVSFNIDVDGILKVGARDLATRSERAVSLRIPNRSDDVEELVEQARMAEIEKVIYEEGGSKL